MKLAFEKFKNTVLSQGYDDVFPSLFTKESHLHMTLCMLPLGEEGQVGKAIAAMIEVEEKIRELVKTEGSNE